MKLISSAKIITKLTAQNSIYKLDLIRMGKKYKKLTKERDYLSQNCDYLFNENVILKRINKKRYVQQEERMRFLIEREKKLQTIEQMVANKEDFRKIRTFIKGE